MLRKTFEGFTPVDAIYPGKSFDAVDNVKKNFGLTLDEVIDQAVSAKVMNEARFKAENSRNIGAVGVIVRSCTEHEEDGVKIGKATVNLIMNSGKHPLLPSWLPSGDLIIRFAKEVEKEEGAQA